MKTLNEYLALPYRMELVKDPDEGGFVPRAQHEAEIPQEGAIILFQC